MAAEFVTSYLVGMGSVAHIAVGSGRREIPQPAEITAPRPRGLLGAEEGDEEGEGDSHSDLFALASQLRKLSKPYEEALELVLLVASSSTPPVGEEEAARHFRDAWLCRNEAERLEMVMSLNERHCIVGLGGNVFVGTEDVDPQTGEKILRLGSEEDLVRRYRHWLVETWSGEVMFAAEYWRGHSGNRSVTEVPMPAMVRSLFSGY